MKTPCLLILLFCLLCGFAATNQVCEHNQRKVLHVATHQYPNIWVTNRVEEVYYTVISVSGRDDRAMLESSLAGAKMGWKWGRWDADWPDVSNNVYKTWAYMYNK